MEQILVYADSLTWGLIPNTRERLPFVQRWPGVMENRLLEAGQSVRVIENCLNGRRTAWGDPFKPGRDGSEHLAQVIEMHSPLALVIIMLGTNDFQCSDDNSDWMSGQGMAKLIQTIKQAPVEPGMPVPPILVVVPPRITQPKGDIAPKFAGAETRYGDLPGVLEQVAREQSTAFFDSNHVISSSQVDGIHLDLEQHADLGTAIAQKVLQEWLHAG